MVDEFDHEPIRRLQQLPGVKSAGLTSFLPASGGNSNTAFIAEYRGTITSPGSYFGQGGAGQSGLPIRKGADADAFP